MGIVHVPLWSRRLLLMLLRLPPVSSSTITFILRLINSTVKPKWVLVHVVLGCCFQCGRALVGCRPFWLETYAWFKFVRGIHRPCHTTKASTHSFATETRSQSLCEWESLEFERESVFPMLSSSLISLCSTNTAKNVLRDAAWGGASSNHSFVVREWTDIAMNVSL